MSQQQQQTNLKPIAPKKIGGMDDLTKNKGKSVPAKPFTPMQNKMRDMYNKSSSAIKTAKMKPIKKSLPKKVGKQPTFSQVQKSISKTMGY